MSETRAIVSETKLRMREIVKAKYETILREGAFCILTVPDKLTINPVNKYLRQNERQAV